MVCINFFHTLYSLPAGMAIVLLSMHNIIKRLSNVTEIPHITILSKEHCMLELISMPYTANQYTIRFYDEKMMLYSTNRKFTSTLKVIRLIMISKAVNDC